MQTTHGCHLLVQDTATANIVPPIKPTIANESAIASAQTLHRVKIICAYLAHPAGEERCKYFARITSNLYMKKSVLPFKGKTD
jgi:hypothetical protein